MNNIPSISKRYMPLSVYAQPATELDHLLMVVGKDDAGTTTSSTANSLRATMFVAPLGVRISEVGVYCTTASAGHNVRFGIYTTKSRGRIFPDRLIWESDSISLSAIGYKAVPVTLDLQPGQAYWFATVKSTNTSSVLRALTKGGQMYPQLGADPTINGADTAAGSLIVAYTFGALPHIFPSTATPNMTTTNTIPIVAVRPVNTLAGESNFDFEYNTVGLGSWGYVQCGNIPFEVWYTPPMTRSNAYTTITPGNYEIAFSHLYAPANVTIDKIGAKVSTVGAAGSTYHLGLYSSLNGRPNKLIYTSPELAGDSAVFASAMCQLPLRGGTLYFLAIQANGNGGAVPTFYFQAVGSNLSLGANSDLSGTDNSKFQINAGSYGLPGVINVKTLIMSATRPAISIHFQAQQ